MIEAMTMLVTIKEGYFTFTTTMVEQASRFPGSIQARVDTYETTLCKILGVEKKIPGISTTPVNTVGVNWEKYLHV